MRLLAVASMIMLGLVGCGGGGGSYSGELVEFTPIDEANLEVVVEFTNTGDSDAAGECTVTAHDASTSVGFDIMGTPEDLGPGESESYRGSLRIEDEGAFRVARVEVTDCGES
jgi:hypothetical protein